MSRIKKRGLDYFPLNTDFMQDRLVRRIMKREGDSALAVLLQALCSVYSGEGYYVRSDSLFYDDLADNLYQQESADVERIIRLAVDYGLFSSELFGKYHILTSADIQRQYLFITKRRSSVLIDSRYNLLPADAPAAVPDVPAASADALVVPAIAPVTPDNVTIISGAEHFQQENAGKAANGTQSIAQHSIAQQTKENSLLYSSPETGGTAGAGSVPVEEQTGGEDNFSFRQGSGNTENGLGEQGAASGKHVRREWTDADVNALQPPRDGLQRNLDGLIFNMRQYRIPPQEQCAIIFKSNFGIIGHPLWKGFCALRESHGKIRQPGKYLLSLCR